MHPRMMRIPRSKPNERRGDREGRRTTATARAIIPGVEAAHKILELSCHARTLERIGATNWAGRPGAVLTGRGPAKSYLTLPVTADFFGTLGVAAQQGRTFIADDLGGGC